MIYSEYFEFSSLSLYIFQISYREKKKKLDKMFLSC